MNKNVLERWNRETKRATELMPDHVQRGISEGCFRFSASSYVQWTDRPHLDAVARICEEVLGVDSNGFSNWWVGNDNSVAWNIADNDAEFTAYHNGTVDDAACALLEALNNCMAARKAEEPAPQPESEELKAALAEIERLKDRNEVLRYALKYRRDILKKVIEADSE